MNRGAINGPREKDARMSRIAFLGAGTMGSAMVPHLLGAGHEVTVYNRTLERARPLEALGARLAATPAEAVADAEVTMSIVLDDAASRAVWSGEGGVLGAARPGTLAIECSTVSNDWVLELAGLAGGRGLRFVDCAVAGRPDAAVRADLRMFAGGDIGDVEEARAIMACFGRRFTRFGPVGSGNAYKLIYNTVGCIQVVALIEGMHACEAAGIDLEAAADAFSVGQTGSGHVKRHSRYVASGIHEDPIHFSGRNRLKDVSYGISFIRKVGAQSKMGEACAGVLRQMIDVGMGERNDSELIDALREIHGRRRNPNTRERTSR